METFFNFIHFLNSVFLLGYIYAHWQQGKEIARLKSLLKDEQACFISEREYRRSTERKFCHQLDAASDLLDGIKNAISDYELNTKDEAEETP